MLWNGRRYFSLDCRLKQVFSEKLYKLSLDGGMSCPNRDGTISYGGCIFCSEGGSGDFTPDCRLPISQQIELAKCAVKNKFSGNRYIAYFQAFTNTYAPVEYLEKLFRPVVSRDDIAVLSVATRPDCLEADKLSLLESLAKEKPLWIELGLQTANENTAKFINRGYELPCFERAVRELKNIGAEVIVHTIIGLPHETKDDIIATARYVGSCGADGIKIQLLHILENTKLAELYRAGEFEALSEEDYIDIVCDVISVLPQNIVIHRLTGDGDRSKLIAPKWSGDKRHVINAINHRLKERNIFQGCNAFVH